MGYFPEGRGTSHDKSSESQNQRTIKLFELGRTTEDHLVQLPSNEQGHLQLHQVAQSPIQPDLECLQGCLVPSDTEQKCQQKANDVAEYK